MARHTRHQSLKLPDQLKVRYFRADEIEAVSKVETEDGFVVVTVGERTDRWRDLGGGLGFVPDESG